MATFLLVWHALSPLGLLLGAAGAGILVVVVMGLVTLPGWASRTLTLAAGALLAAGLVYQTGYASATNAAELRRAREIAETNRRRAEAAEAALAADRTRAEADAARIDALKREIDATPRDPAGCLPAAAAERVRRVR